MLSDSPPLPSLSLPINTDADEAERLLTAGQCAAAAKKLTRAIAVHRHSPSRALKAWMLLHGRVGVARDCNRAFALVEKGTRLGCHDCQGVMAFCYGAGVGCEEDMVRSLELARESAGRGSRYGQFTLGKLLFHGQGGAARDKGAAFALFRLAATFDGAQVDIGDMYRDGHFVDRDRAEALRWYHLAAAQGNPTALYNVASCYEEGDGIRKSKAAAIRWYKRAQAAGDSDVAAGASSSIERINLNARLLLQRSA